MHKDDPVQKLLIILRKQDLESQNKTDDEVGVFFLSRGISGPLRVRKNLNSDSNR